MSKFPANVEPIRPDSEFNQIKIADVAAAVLGVAQPFSSRIGDKKIPPPTPIIPLKKPIPPPQGNAFLKFKSLIFLSAYSVPDINFHDAQNNTKDNNIS